MITKEQTDNQANKVLDSIPKETIEKAIKEGKIILLSVDGEKHKMKAVELIDNIIDPKVMLTSLLKSALRTHNYPLKPSTIDRLEFDEEKKFLKELKKYINSHSWFYTLFINNLTDFNDDLAYILEKLKDSMEEKGRDYFKVSLPNKSEINKAILDKYKVYPILKQIKKEKNLAYQIKEHLQKTGKALRNNKHKTPSVSVDELQRNMGILALCHGEPDGLTEDEKEEMKECSNDILIDNKSEIKKIISKIKPREKNELYKLIMEKPPRSLIIINFHGKVLGKFRKRFQGEYVEIPPSLSEPRTEVEQGKGNASSNLTDNIFCYRDGRWQITFGDKTFYPKEMDGFRYISYVLSNPRNDLHNYRIYQSVKDLETGLVTEGQRFDAKLYHESSTKIQTTEEDKGKDYQDYKNRIAALDKEDDELKKEKSELEIDNVDMSRLEEIDEQLNQNSETRKSIAKDFKSGGKVKSENEKTAYNVYMSIYRSLSIIKKEHPILHTHLKAFFTNGKEFTSYYPDRDIPWQTNRS